MKTKHKISCASHLATMLNPARAKYTAKQVVKMIKARGLQFDAIACRGVSSLLISPIVAMRLNKSLIVVRKGEKTHSTYKVEGDHGAKRYLIIDDFIDSGDTIREIAKDIFDVNKDAQCVGFIAYERLSFKLQAIWAAEKEAAAPCPKGRVKIEGTVLKVEERETQWGFRTVMTVKSNDGWITWGSTPSGITVEKDCKIVFVATVEPSEQDAKFGFHKIPKLYLTPEEKKEQKRARLLEQSQQEGTVASAPEI